MISLTSIPPEEIKQKYLHLFRNDTQYFFIMKNNEIAGIYGIINRDFGNAEVFMTIFKEYRFKVLNKKTLDLVINTSFDFGFTTVWSWTTWRSWIRLLRRLKDVEQVLPPSWDLEDPTRIWFRKGI